MSYLAYAKPFLIYAPRKANAWQLQAAHSRVSHPDSVLSWHATCTWGLLEPHSMQPMMNRIQICSSFPLKDTLCQCPADTEHGIDRHPGFKGGAECSDQRSLNRLSMATGLADLIFSTLQTIANPETQVTRADYLNNAKSELDPSQPKRHKRVHFDDNQDDNLGPT